MPGSVYDDLHSAICRSMSTIELTGDASVDQEALCASARDSLYTLSVAIPAQSYALIVRLSDKRVLATTCDADCISNSELNTSQGSQAGSGDLSIRASVVAQLAGERLVVRAPRSVDFLNALTANADDTDHWFEDGTICTRV